MLALTCHEFYNLWGVDSYVLASTQCGLRNILMPLYCAKYGHWKLLDHLEKEWKFPWLDGSLDSNDAFALLVIETGDLELVKKYNINMQYHLVRDNCSNALFEYAQSCGGDSAGNIQNCIACKIFDFAREKYEEGMGQWNRIQHLGILTTFMDVERLPSYLDREHGGSLSSIDTRVLFYALDYVAIDLFNSPKFDAVVTWFAQNGPMKCGPNSGFGDLALHASSYSKPETLTKLLLLDKDKGRNFMEEIKRCISTAMWFGRHDNLEAILNAFHRKLAPDADGLLAFCILNNPFLIEVSPFGDLFGPEVERLRVHNRHFVKGVKTIMKHFGLTTLPDLSAFDFDIDYLQAAALYADLETMKWLVSIGLEFTDVFDYGSHLEYNVFAPEISRYIITEGLGKKRDGSGDDTVEDEGVDSETLVSFDEYPLKIAFTHADVSLYNLVVTHLGAPSAQDGIAKFLELVTKSSLEADFVFLDMGLSVIYGNDQRPMDYLWNPKKNIAFIQNMLKSGQQWTSVCTAMAEKHTRGYFRDELLKIAKASTTRL